MTDLQFGLLLIGAVAVAAVLIYNRMQERAAGRQAERSFGSRHADALLGEPDARLDYLVELSLPRGVPTASLRELWAPLEHRFAKRVLLAASSGSEWHAAFQLVSRAGVASESELLEFRSALETLAAKIGAAVSAPEMRQALDAARSLDRVCARADIQVALHVVGAPLPGSQSGDHAFQVTAREDGVTLTLDVARTTEPARSFQAMARTGRELAATHGARLVDDNGNLVDERALAAIGTELEAVRQMLVERGIEPGSPLALRLFS
ncbi:MAG TPA: cell division protein ZipA C-terminal FtsZ-binding domain-containing protein [Burkholderiales bacterium]|nr:cell division protein ZipA C-terminal FtsZ-binding domain-containing protein [Burkholderiales bacterium]